MLDTNQCPDDLRNHIVAYNTQLHNYQAYSQRADAKNVIKQVQLSNLKRNFTNILTHYLATHEPHQTWFRAQRHNVILEFNAINHFCGGLNIPHLEVVIPALPPLPMQNPPAMPALAQPPSNLKYYSLWCLKIGLLGGGVASFAVGGTQAVKGAQALKVATTEVAKIAAKKMIVQGGLVAVAGGAAAATATYIKPANP